MTAKPDTPAQVYALPWAPFITSINRYAYSAEQMRAAYAEGRGDALRTQAGQGAAPSPEETVESYLASIISRSPDPLLRLGDYLQRVMDEDQWTTAERHVLAAAEACAQRASDAAMPAGSRLVPVATLRNWWHAMELADEKFTARELPSARLRAAMLEVDKVIVGPQPEAPAAGQQAVEPSDAALLALNAGELHFSETPSRYPKAGHGTQYHAGAPGLLSFARAAIALANTPTAAAPAPVAQDQTCEWHLDDDETGLWQSACGGDPWRFEADDPTKNGMRFCIHCGKRMVQRATKAAGKDTP